ncbi:MAG: hypothetical protein PHR87_12680 [Sulfurospirillaceae bacterium]|nr:hypothetical protein [Sulfurospirillaceae bacterium]
MLKIFHKIKSLYQTKLSYQHDSKSIEKLTKWSIVLIVLLDIFVYSSIQMGITFQTATLNSPESKVDYQCRNILQDSTRVKEYNWYRYTTSTSKPIPKIDAIYANGKTAQSQQVIQAIKHQELDARCVHIQTQIDTIAHMAELAEIKKTIASLGQTASQYTKDLHYIQNNYNTVLFEKMAHQQETKSILEMDLDTQNVKAKYDTLQHNLASVNQKISTLKEQFSTHPLVSGLYDFIVQNKESILRDYEKATSHYFLKKAGIIVLFLLPIVGLFYWQMSVQNAKRHYTQYIICKNIFLISMAFLILNTIRIVYNFIPHLFLEKVLMFFYSIKIPFIAYYLLLALGIIVLSFAIMKLQNFAKNKTKTTITFIESYKLNKCDKCGIKVDYTQMNFCPNCNNTLKIKCHTCGSYTIAKLDYCAFCGEKKELDKA